MIPSAGWFAANPWRRISAKQVDLFRRCPARWGYRYLDWHQEPRTAVMFAGVAVQNAVEDVLRMSPPDEVRIGMDLSVWIRREMTSRFGERWAEQMEAFRSSPGVVGEWDLNHGRFLAYAISAGKMHSAIVSQFWTGPGRLADAWEAARPEMPGNDLRVIPEGWYQWAADLIYTMPDGERVLVDMKVGRGGEWVPKYEEQMRSYLWADDHSRPGETPARGVLWLLGAETIVHDVAPWDEDEIARFLARCYAMLRAARVRDEDPSSLRFLLPHAAMEKDCRTCPYSGTCPSPMLPKASIPTTAPVGAYGYEFGEIDSAPTGRRAKFSARIIGIGDPKEKNGKRTCRVTLANASGMRSYSWDEHHVERLGLRVGQVVALSGLRTWAPPEGRATMLFADQFTECHS